MMVFLAPVLSPELPESPLLALRLGGAVSAGADDVKVCATGVPLMVLMVVTVIRGALVSEVADELSAGAVVDGGSVVEVGGWVVV